MVLLCPICGNDTKLNPRNQVIRCQYCKRELTLKKKYIGKGSRRFRFELEEKEQ